MRKRWIAFIAGSIVGTTLTARAAGSSKQGAPPTKTKTRDPVVTPVAGPSWLNRLGLRYSETSLGRSGATYGPPHTATTVSARRGAVGGWTAGRTERADLYRLNCQSCHRAEGTGSPPEIKSFSGSCRDRRSSWCDSTCRRRGRRRLDRRRAHRPLERGPISTSEFRKAANACRRSRTCRKPTSTLSTPT